MKHRTHERDEIPANLYQYLVVECRGVCSLCHGDTIAQIHHIEPAAEGGKSDYSNLIPLCASCHAKVHKTNSDRAKLRVEKARWAKQCRGILTRYLSSESSSEYRKRSLLEAFDAVENIAEFEGFRKRLRGLLDRGDLFDNFFRVLRHDIRHRVDIDGKSRTSEVQRFSPFVPFEFRNFHLSADQGASSRYVGFRISGRMQRQPITIKTSLKHDEPKNKSYHVEFTNMIPANKKVELSFSFTWPKAWNVRRDRYTYDVLGWAERVNYEMIFPPAVKVIQVGTSFIDIFKREWPNIGHSEIAKNRFRWKGTRLPMLSSVIIQYETDY